MMPGPCAPGADRRADALLLRFAGGGECRGQLGAASTALAECSHGGGERIDHLFSPSLAAASSTTPASAASSAATSSSAPNVRRLRASARCGERRPERRPAPPTVETSVEPAVGSSRPGGREEPDRAAGRQPRTALHVRAVIGIADRSVELGQIVALLADRRRRSGEPPSHRASIHARSSLHPSTRPTAAPACAPEHPTGPSARRRARAA